MKNISVVLSLAVIGFFLSLSVSWAQELEGDVESGRKLYSAYNCYACHGYTGETARVRLNPLLFTLPDFIDYLRDPPEMPGGFGMGFSMPAYAGPDVSEQDLADVYAYIRSLPSTSLDLEDILLLNEE